MQKHTQPVSTELYTAEAAESRRRAIAEVGVPDPDEREAAEALERNTVRPARRDASDG